MTMKPSVVTAALAAVLLASAQPAAAQPRPLPPLDPMPMRAPGQGAIIGVSPRDVDRAEADRLKIAGGVSIDTVRSGSPAERAGIRAADVIVEFDGEPVRSARQFARLVQETAPGRTVRVVLLRAGTKLDVSVVPEAERPLPGAMLDGNQLRDRLGHLGDMLDLNLDLDLMDRGARLGATVQALTPQLASYFGAKQGVLIASVAENSAASRAGLKAGDVITAIDGHPIGSRLDLVRTLRGVRGQETTIAIVRDKRESSVRATIERPGRRRDAI